MTPFIRTLLIEDNPADVVLIRAMLHDAASVRFELRCTDRLAAGLSEIARETPDVILLDLSLPDSQGIETFARVYGEAPQVPILALTGLADEAMAAAAVGQGAQDYLVKGDVDPQGLARAVRYAIERKRLEEQLQRARRLEALGRLAGGIAHDFNNLLTVILGHSELLAMRMPSSDARRHEVEEISRAAERAARMTRQLLAFGRHQILRPAALDLNEVVRDLLPMLRRLIHEDIELSTTFEPGLGAVLADPVQMEQVVLNLVLNARDAMPRGGTVDIRTTNVNLDAADPRCPPAHAGAFVLLSVGDSGAGMAPDVAARVFEPFFTTKEEGTGLGLATVYGIVQQSGGSIHVESEPGRGSVFRVHLPRVDPARRVHPRQESVEPQAAGSGTLLVVEDNAAVRGFARDALEHLGYRVLTAGTGREALELCELCEAGIDLVITDVIMPGISGPELARRLRGRWPATRVLYASGYTGDVLFDQGRIATDAPVLAKPYTLAQLGRAVREALDVAPAPEPKRLPRAPAARELEVTP
jgi:signal transduction histidine kinase